MAVSGIRSGYRGFGPFLWHGAFLALAMSMADLNTVLPSLISRLVADPLAFGAAYSILAGAPLLFGIPFSRLQEKAEKRKKFLLIGIYARAASFAGLGLAVAALAPAHPLAAYLALLALVLVFAASGGFAGIAYTELVGRLIPPEGRGRLYASRQAIGGLAALFGGAVVAALFGSASFAYPRNYAAALAIGAAALLAASLGFWRIREEGRTGPAGDGSGAKPSGSAIAALRRDPRLLRFLVIENVSGAGLMVLPFYIAYVQSSFESAGPYLGAYLVAQTIGAIGSNFAWSAVSARIGPRKVMALCLGLGGALPILALALRPLGPLAYVGLFFLVGFVMSGRNIGFEPAFLEIAPAAERTRYLGIRGSFGLLLAALPLAGGLLIRTWGFAPTFAGVAAVMIAASAYSALKCARQQPGAE